MGKRVADHLRAQRAGKVRDLFICQICGRAEKAEGHHIIDHQFGGAGIVDNIITLCQKCHKEVHRGNMDILKF